MFKKNQIIEITNYNSMFNQQIPKDVPLYFHSYEKDDNNETYYITRELPTNVKTICGLRNQSMY